MSHFNFYIDHLAKSAIITDIDRLQTNVTKDTATIWTYVTQTQSQTVSTV